MFLDMFNVKNDTRNDRFCKECGLYKSCKSPKMNVTGSGLLECLLIAEAPGSAEDKQGKQLVGDSGKLLRSKLESHGLDLDRDFWKINSVNCRPPSNRKPKTRELKCCWFKIEQAIKELKPKHIWLLGGSAIESFFVNLYPGRFSNHSVSLWRGYCIPDKVTNTWVSIINHPSALLHNQDMGLENIFDRDLEAAVKNLDREKPTFEEYNKLVDILIDFDLIKERLIDTKNKKIIAFDYETSSIKPYKEGNKVWSISVSDGKRAFAFPYDYPGRFTDKQHEEIKNLWVDILKDLKIKKIAQNMAFEEEWSRVILGTKVANWEWDTMIFSHVFDARGSNTGLKFQSYVRYGIEDYAQPVSKYIVASPSGFNRLNRLPLDNLLYYNAIDSLLTFKIYEDQNEDLRSIKSKILRDKTINIYNLFHSGVLTFVDLQEAGIPVNRDYFKEQDNLLEEEIKEIDNFLNNSLEARRFERYTGNKINWDSSKDLRTLLFEILKLPSYKTTPAGNESVDKEVLGSLEDINVVGKLLEHRRLEKARNTYLSQFIRYEVDNKIHPSFHIHIARTGRSCIAKGSKIMVVGDNNNKYPNGKNIEDIKPGDLVYCYDDNLKPRIKKVLWSGKTGYKKLIRLHWISGNRKRKGYIDLTPEHKVRLSDGRYIEAKNLTGDLRNEKQNKRSARVSVLSVSRSPQIDKINFTGCERLLEHRFIYEEFFGKLNEKDHVHHKDENHFNNNPNNLCKLSNREHPKLHSKNNICRPDVRKKNIEIIKQNWKEGKYDHIIKRGSDCSNYLNFSKIKCLKMLSSSGGHPTKINHDFATILYYFDKYNIKYKDISLRYDKNGKFISRGRLKSLLNKKHWEIQLEIGKGYYNTNKLIKYYGFDRPRKWANQFGSFVANNHCITKIEYIDKWSDVYDIEVEDCHNFIANEICVHNSSDCPNMQNIPVRNDKVKKMIRGGIVPSKGNRLVEADFGALEVRGIACYGKDPELIKDIADPHSFWAKKAFIVNEEQKTKDIRFYTKNQLVFPLFYGSWYKSCAPNLWKNCIALKTGEGISVKQHLENKGIRNFEDFEYHIQKTEEEFWNKFKVTKEWQNKLIDDYNKKGYVDTFFGFKRTGYLSRNEIINAPIQGTCFHILLSCLIELNRIRKDENWKTKIICQVHDSIILDVCPDEFEHVCKIVKYTMSEWIREKYLWIIVPLLVEFEATEIDQSWYYKKVIDV